MGKTIEGENAEFVMLLDPVTEEPTGVEDAPLWVQGDFNSIPIDASPADYHGPGDNLAAVVTYAAVAGKRHVLTGVSWSYDADPTGGNLTVTMGGTVRSWDITTGGPGFIPFVPFIQGAINQAAVITLAAGGAGIAGKVSILGHKVV